MLNLMQKYGGGSPVGTAFQAYEPYKSGEVPVKKDWTICDNSGKLLTIGDLANWDIMLQNSKHYEWNQKSKLD